ncbi:nuclear transport factor 2 family protein [Frateuria sp.]|uniref:nuclear transport factor 2 family protein n=1 Tax=Frateuria sp. TaxID=2211372 RepID=UPI001800B084|nr:nuclear transport factor 2 family protein [Frateuria sp.]NUR21912.1 nuclear transport factor 2 family protein [Frateuria sp.]
MRALIDRYIDAYNRLDVGGMLAALHPQVTFENVTAGVITVRTQGIEEFRRLAQSTLPLFARRRQTVTAYSEKDGVAHVGIAFEGVFALDLPNGARAGQTIALNGHSEFRVHDGLLIHIADISD